MELPVILIFVFLVFGQVALLIYIFRLDEKAKEMMTRLPKQNFGLMHNAYRRAQDIISQAELSSIKMRAINRLRSKKISKTLVTDLDESEKKIEKAFLEASGRADAKFLNYLNKLQEESKKQEEAFLKASEHHLNHLFTNLEENIKTDVNAYKTSRMAALDENILAITQRAVGLVLTKKLTIADQADLVYEALEKAKQEKLIV